MNSRKKVILVLLALILAVALAAAAFVLINMGEDHPQPTEVPSLTTTPTETQTVSTVPETTVPAETMAPTTVPAETEPPVTDQPTVPVAPAETAPPYIPPAPQETLPSHLVFPYTIPDTDLELQAVNSYDGIFLEDGSDTEIAGVASIIVKNNGTKCVEYAKIILTGTVSSFQFEVTGLDAGATAVVMEAGKSPVVEQEYDAVTADTATTEFFERSEGLISVEETPEGQLKVTNLTEQTVPVVRLFYKFYLPEEAVYVGGITYTVKITGLESGASAVVAPSHYAPGSSRVIMIKTYDTDTE